MTDKNTKFTRWIVLFIFILPFALNLIWPIDGFLWAYWVSRFLLGGGMSVIGFSFIIFPKAMMRLLITNKDDYNTIEAWRLVVSGLIAGIPIFLFGVNFLATAVRRWITECANVIDCIK